MRRINEGSVTVEACLVVPLFLFFMLSVAGIYMVLMAETHIHQSLAEAADYTAQYCYLESRTSTRKADGIDNLICHGILSKRFRTCLGKDFYVEKMVVNGVGGILMTVTADEENCKIFIAEIRYFVKIKIPVLGEFHVALSNRIKQKAFLGYSREEQSDCYVYITPNQEVYHTRRSCTHLELQVKKLGIGKKGDYKPCSFCGRKADCGKSIYVARTGDVYHCNIDCLGLKRTVKRVRLAQAGGLGPCLRCGGNVK
ncbi:MAG: pilus assembly protein [Lachnospiraceae bacterium]|nr:pilus assembly protein [Lachnospiraceae bacterium]